MGPFWALARRRASGPSAASLACVSHRGGHAALLLEALERGVERAACDRAAGARLDQAADWDGVGLLAEVEDCQQDGVFEFTKVEGHVCNAGMLRLQCRHCQRRGG